MRENGYPCWLYSAAGAHLFQTEAEHEAFEGDLYESPADVPAPEAEALVHADLMEKAAALGLAVDRRWGDKRLAAEIAKLTEAAPEAQ